MSNKPPANNNAARAAGMNNADNNNANNNAAPANKNVLAASNNNVKKFDPAELEYSISMKGLKEWYNEVFEKLGWMVLASRDDRETKLTSYKEGLLRLHAALKEKHTYVTDVDDKNDIEIYLYNLDALIEHVRNDFNGMPKVESLTSRLTTSQAGGGIRSAFKKLFGKKSVKKTSSNKKSVKKSSEKKSSVKKTSEKK